MILYDFQDTIEDYANKVVLCSALRKPAYDYWSEIDVTGWDHTAVQIEVDLQNSPVIVGSNSLRAYCPPGGGGAGYYWYPSSQDAAWDFTKCGSEKTIPSINFYGRRNDTLQAWSLSLCTNAVDTFSLVRNINTDLANVDEWYHFSIPIGPYYDRAEDVTDLKWTENNNPDWADIDYIEFALQTTANTRYVYIDDLHFKGRIVREAYDSSEIDATNREHQKTLRMDTAVDDSMKQADDTGTAARLAYAELLRRVQTPIVGLIRIPGAPTLLPGQTLYIQACQQSSGSYRIQKDMRVKELKHIFDAQGFRTILNLTDDVMNSHAIGVPTAYSLLKEYAGALRHSEARDLKGSGIDNQISRLSVAY